MKTKLCLAVLAASLVTAPAAMAQGASRSDDLNYEKSTNSAGNSEAPVVNSLPGVQNDPWTGTAATSGSSADGTMHNRNDYGHGGYKDGARARSHHNQAGMSGSTGSAMDRTATGSAYSRSSDRMTGRDAGQGMSQADLAGRRGPGQRPIELAQTTLLNRLSASGYSMVRDFRKDGDMYVASAMDPQGQWSTVVLNPHTGDISQRR
ncbi:hypothetical protein [Azospirillum picis]|uniref:PepSY domain-containing protein n=1 Tax=Azospirillum picis TaxID=488438 RepID=A0ABU0MTN9_9PROT|nr:hypothetical protein [Azospirillum picis]MBP2303103.1 hypothetical protein [Azospirillum picis]MDQ0536855.1 hypothetical protein [Azospirillum picis]